MCLEHEDDVMTVYFSVLVDFFLLKVLMCALWQGIRPPLLAVTFMVFVIKRDNMIFDQTWKIHLKGK